MNLKSIFSWIFFYLTGPFLGLLLFIIDNKGISLGEAKAPSLLYALIGYVVGQHIVQGIDSERAKRRLSSRLKTIDNTIDMRSKTIEKTINSTADSFKNYVASAFKVSYVPNSEIYLSIAASVARAHHVKNTYVGIRELTGATSSRAVDFCRLYQDFLSREDVTWQDIVGVGELLDGRYEQIDAECTLRMKGTHEIFMITTHVPVLNFILLGPQQAEFNEVYFGWIKTNTTDIDVFYSHDIRLVSMFNNYFEGLKHSHNRVTLVPINYLTTSANRLSDSVAHRLSGKWLSISGSAKKISTQNRPDRSKDELLRYAIINIYFDNEWKIEGQTYNFLSQKLENNFVSEMCTLIGNSIYYTFKNRDNYRETMSTGIGCYKLAIDEPKLSGHYAIGKKSGHAALLRAIKIDGAQAGDKAYIDKMIRGLVTVDA